MILQMDSRSFIRPQRQSLRRWEKRKRVHRQRLTELYKRKFGDHIPLIRRQDVKGFVKRKSLWLTRPLKLEAVRGFAATMELETKGGIPYRGY